MQEHQAPLFSKHFKGGSQSYFFDVKAAKNGSKYLAITQSRIKDGQKFRNSIVLFSNDLPEFNEAFAEMQEKVK